MKVVFNINTVLIRLFLYYWIMIRLILCYTYLNLIVSHKDYDRPSIQL